MRKISYSKTTAGTAMKKRLSVAIAVTAKYNFHVSLIQLCNTSLVKIFDFESRLKGGIYQ